MSKKKHGKKTSGVHESEVLEANENSDLSLGDDTDDLTLGASDDESLSLGADDESLSLDGDDPLEQETAHDDKTETGMLSLEEISDALMLGKDVISGKWDVRFSRNPKFYALFSLPMFKYPDETERSKIEQWKNAWIKQAETRWGKTKEETLNDFKAALTAAWSILSNEDQHENFSQGFKEFVFGQKESLIDNYLKDKTIDSLELAEIVRDAQQSGIWYSDETKNDFLERTRRYIEKKGGKVASYEDSFLLEVAKLKPEQLIRCEKNVQELTEKLGLYKKEYNYVEGITDQIRQDFLRNELEHILSVKGFYFIEKADFFEKNFLSPYLKSHSISLSDPLSGDDYTELRFHATKGCFFSDDDWNKYCENKGISRKKESSKEFSMGFDQNEQPLKANSPEEIVALYCGYPEKAKSNLYDGYLEQYLLEIGDKDLKNRIGRIKRDYPEDKRAGLQRAIFTLQSDKPFRLQSGAECIDSGELAFQLESDANAISKTIVRNLNNDIQLWLEARDENEKAVSFREMNSRKYYSDKKILNGLIFILDGGNFRRDDRLFYFPDQIVQLPSDEFKKNLAYELKDPDSKMSVWIEEKYPDVNEKVVKWRQFGRFNEITITYPLESGSPFYLFDARLLNAYDVESYISKNHKNVELIRDLTSSSKLREELEFWLVQYSSTTAYGVLRSFLKSNKKNPEYRNAFSAVISHLAHTDFEANDFKYYWENYVSLFETARLAGTVSEASYDQHFTRLLKGLKENSGSSTDSLVVSYLESVKDNQDVNKKLIQELITYFIRADVKMSLFTEQIQPLTVHFVEKQGLDKAILEQQKQFYILKYQSEIPKVRLEEQEKLIEAIRVIDSDNMYVKFYDDALNATFTDIKRINFASKNRYARKRDLLLLAGVLFSILIAAVSQLPKYISLQHFYFNPVATGWWTIGLLSVLLIVLLRLRKKSRR